MYLGLLGKYIKWGLSGESEVKMLKCDVFYW